MHRWVGTLLLASLVLALAACGGGTIRAEDVQLMAPSEAKALVDDGEVVLYDVRSVKSYEAKHIAGAVSLPETQVDARLSELPDDKTLIFY